VRTSKILLEKNQQKIISIFLVFIICLYGFVSINYRFATVIKPIYSNSNLFILNELKLCSDNQIANGILVVKRTKPWPSRQLLGFFSQTTDLASEWVPIGSVKLVLIKNSKDFNEIEFTSSEYRNKSFCYVQLDKF